ncbi:hypothetical protein ANN_22560 [Periplaneta americana]|uniref:Uncharacterized protein n=1 Tax=Periplaneta americana TaxID=6978 RepID=A0ABQ8S8G8_PERAM|nr:hypothetical protein ANN_22560 [Periplaneta americana]
MLKGRGSGREVRQERERECWKESGGGRGKKRLCKCNDRRPMKDMVGEKKLTMKSERANGLRITRGRLPSEISTNFIHDLHTNDLEKELGRKRGWALFREGESPSWKEVCQLVACGASQPEESAAATHEWWQPGPAQT